MSYETRQTFPSQLLLVMAFPTVWKANWVGTEADLGKWDVLSVVWGSPVLSGLVADFHAAQPCGSEAWEH